MLGCILSNQGFAQDKVFLVQDTNLNTIYGVNDSLSCERFTLKLIRQHREEGYLLSHAIRDHTDSDTSKIIVSGGPRFTMSKLGVGSLKDFPDLMERVNHHVDTGTYVDIKTLSKLQQELVDLAEQNGLPFASVYFSPTKVEGTQLEAEIQFRPGPVIYWDSIHLMGDPIFERKFAHKLFEIEPGAQYNERAMEGIAAFIQRNRVYKLKEPVSTTFIDNKAIVHLNMERALGNELSGVIGILPNTGNQGGVVLTGDVKAHLHNLFSRNKEAEFRWSRQQSQTQSLLAAYRHHNLFGSKLGVSGELDLLKQDTTFLTVKRALFLEWNARKLGAMKAFSRKTSSGPLGGGMLTNNIVTSEVLGYDWTQFGFQWELGSIDDPYFPQRGTRFFLECATGNKVLQSTSSDSLEESTLQSEVRSMVEVYYPLYKKMVVKGGVDAYALFNNQGLLINDAHRIGGFSTLKGFNENQFYATSYQILTAELRYYVDLNFYFYGFMQQGFYDLETIDISRQDRPLGLGLGMVFATRNGVFNFTYSLGRSQEQPFAANLSKVHFGLQSKF